MSMRLEKNAPSVPPGVTESPNVTATHNTLQHTSPYCDTLHYQRRLLQ
eukprot:CAMPEP_0179439134 /NCGR_PEP_ID=MMETSP0799-20121207/22776_1 /TAXON_ID=46947 /ORGANISM="Geminigera cryophila, Strain CCMP2564" /LENGTH=47 /DNA_ID= /DNA_START= /DNA_END= /DNA_ORIENTATION=